MPEDRLEANKVSIKIPPFWREKPEIWFYQVEAQFNICKIVTEETKFNHLVSQLEPKYIENIWDIIRGTEVNKYSLAKECLLNIFKESEDKRIKRLVTGIDLGDQKPSQLLRRMQALAGADVSEKVLKTLWLEKLPESTRNILIVTDEGLEKVAVMADRIMEMNPRNELFATKSETGRQQDVPVTMSDIMTRITGLEQQIAAFSADPQGRQCQRSFDRRRNNSRSKSQNKYNPRGKYCYYHFRFGHHCRPEKCTPPCTWTEQGNAPQQLN
jgi:hypothetical protein